jgi:quercetin dioxygenase-like cupin family protein
MVVSSNVVLFLPGVQPTCAALNRERPTWGELDEMEESMKGKHSPPGAGNIYAKANEVIVKVTGGDTGQTFEVVEENCKPGFQSRAHYHIKAYETFYVFEGSADFQVSMLRKVRAFTFRPACRIR